MPCDECDTLRRQVRELREELERSRPDLGRADRLALKYRLQPREAKVLAAMVERAGQVLPVAEICKAAGYAGSGTHKAMSETVRVSVYEIRTRLLDRGIRSPISSLYRKGWVLSPVAARVIDA